MTAGLGDLYLYGEYGLLPEQAVLPYVSANLKLKVPTAATGNNFGSGEFDYGLGIVLRKSINTYVGFVDIGYWILGDPPGVNYKDPLTIGAGVGRFFGYGRYALMGIRIQPPDFVGIQLSPQSRINCYYHYGRGIERNQPGLPAFRRNGVGTLNN
jgi:hypothetical protein